MKIKAAEVDLNEYLDEYERWIAMGWGVNHYEDDDILPIISLRDDIHEMIQPEGRVISENDKIRLKELDKRWQDFLGKNRDPSFRFDFKSFSQPRTRWWWWIDRLDELTAEERNTI